MAVHVIILGKFLCRSLQNSNVKLLNSAFSGEREPQQVIFAISMQVLKCRQTHWMDLNK